MNFRIDKERREIRVALVDGRALQGHVFLEPSDVLPGQAIRVLDLLLKAEGFLPFNTYQGEFLILRQDAIVAIRVAAAHELRSLTDIGLNAFVRADLEVSVMHHSSVRGALYIEPIEGFSRPLDEINRAKGFLTVHVGEEAVLVNVRHVVDIRLRS